MTFKKLLILTLLFTSSAFAGEFRVGRQDIMEQLAKAGTRSFIINPQCEKNTDGITDGSSILTRNTTNAAGDFGTDCAIDATGSGQLVEWLWKTYPKRIENQSCESILWFKGDASFYKMKATQNSAEVNSRQLWNSTLGQVVALSHPCGSNANPVTVGVESTSASAAAINVLWLHGGEATNIGDGAAITGWTSYTPTTQGIGTISSVDLQWRQVGDSIQIKGSFTTGTVTGDEARLGLPNSYTIRLPSTAQLLGYLTKPASTTGTNSILGSNGNSYVNFSGGIAGGGVDLLTAQGGSTVFVSSTKYTIPVLTIPITQLAFQQVFRVGAPGLETTAFTGALKGTTSGTFSNQTTTGFYQCDGGILRVNVSTVFSGTPGVASGNFAWDLPTGFTIDTTKINSSSQYIQPLGIAQFYDDNTTNRSQGTVDYFSTTQVAVLTDGGAATAWSPSAPVTVATNDRATLIFSVPVTASSPCPRTPMPLLSQAVTTSSAGVEIVNRARINNNGSVCSTDLETGDWISSLTYNGTGDCTLSFTTGTFSATPNCFVTSEEGSAVTVLTSAKIASLSSTGVRVRHSVITSGSSTIGGTNNPVHILCMGPK